jgi:hypothetical protein
MAGTFSVEWLPGGVLLQRRTGLLTPDQAKAYVAAVEQAVQNAPARWGAVVDTREALAQTDEVQQVIQRLIQFVITKNVERVAVVSTSAITGNQQRRITTAPGMHDPSTVTFHGDYDEALDVRPRVACARHVRTGNGDGDGDDPRPWRFGRRDAGMDTRLPRPRRPLVHRRF